MQLSHASRLFVGSVTIMLISTNVINEWPITPPLVELGILVVSNIPDVTEVYRRPSLVAHGINCIDYSSSPSREAGLFHTLLTAWCSYHIDKFNLNKMRFNILCSIIFLATLATGLVIPSDGLEERDLATREGIDNYADDVMMFRREPKSSNAKKARIAAAKPVKAAAKAQRKESFKSAAKAHKGTTNLPGRHSTFHVKAGGGKPARKDVRKAVFHGHQEAHRLKTASKTQAKKSPMKNFNNYNHEKPKAHGGGARPLLHMKVDKTKKHQQPGREFPLPNKHNPHTPSPARVITQKTKGGHHTFKGVIAHDQSRTNTAKGHGYNDHFQVKERKSKVHRH
ncbi:hypothetical protein CPB83DRAFT_910512 [Crepidotus variabilis]|uniref:Uncharacterized protein n=1 Tax=Crepidotus variabilis TaxID=179855 RepID=A0A9P6E772_9AGAR|nr:hypothetical protein CPB83DRAFT_910512 [Crepidotus variabilis]